MKNPLLVPEIRELLAQNDIQVLRDFCTDGHPGVIADLLSGLSIQEVRDVILNVEPSFGW